MSYINLALAVFAAVISIGYFIRPRLHYCVYKRNLNLNGTESINGEKAGKDKGKGQINADQKIKSTDLETSHSLIDPYGEEDWDDDSDIFMDNPAAFTICKEDKDQSIGRQEEYKWVVKVINKNLFCVTVRELECEIAFSKRKDFSKAKTIELIKPKTLFLRSNRINPDTNYLFISKGSGSRYSRYSYLRVRLLASNFLGVKKHYERIYNIADELSEEKTDCDPQCQCYHTMSSSGIKNCCLTNIKCAIWNCFRRNKVQAR